MGELEISGIREMTTQRNPTAERGHLLNLRRFPESLRSRRTLLATMNRLLQNRSSGRNAPQRDMAAVVARFPNRSPRVNSLCGQRVRGFLALQELRCRVDPATPFELDWRICFDRCDWLGTIDSRRRDERKLIQSAVCLDIRGES